MQVDNQPTYHKDRQYSSMAQSVTDLNLIEQLFSYWGQTEGRKMLRKATTEGGYSKGQETHLQGGNSGKFWKNLVHGPKISSRHWLQKIFIQVFKTILTFVSLPNYMWASDNEGLNVQMAAFTKQMIQLSCDTQELNLKVFTSIKYWFLSVNMYWGKDKKIPRYKWTQQCLRIFIIEL